MPDRRLISFEMAPGTVIDMDPPSTLSKILGDDLAHRDVCEITQASPQRAVIGFTVAARRDNLLQAPILRLEAPVAVGAMAGVLMVTLSYQPSAACASSGLKPV
jgi:hypothetical protein